MSGKVYDFTRCVRPDGSVYGSRGKCRKGSEDSKSSGQLRGQELANAMMQYANVENRVRANNKGSLASKKAKAELAEELQKEGIPSKDKLREMAMGQRKEGQDSEVRAKVKELTALKKRLTQLAKDVKTATSKRELAEIRREIESMSRKIKG